MNVSKVGNQTSSQDPQAVNSRVFVGNLNTFQIVKTDVEKMFQKYGRIAGISMHKGYAFVQFTSPFDARSACLGEDGKTLCGQVLDVNMVSEPKAHISKVKAQKRQKEKQELALATAPGLGVPVSSPLLSYYVTSLGGTALALQSPLPLQQAKRPRVDELTSEGADSESPENDIPMDEELDLDSLKTYATPDILICGNCRMVFQSLQAMVAHKRHYCKLRFTCKCENSRDNCRVRNDSSDQLECSDEHQEQPPAPDWLHCSSCQAGFPDPWDLMEHVQEAHTLNIYQLCSPETDSNDNLTSGMGTEVNRGLGATVGATNGYYPASPPSSGASQQKQAQS